MKTATWTVGLALCTVVPFCIRAEPLPPPTAGVIPAPTRCQVLSSGFDLDGSAEIFCTSGAEAEAAEFLKSELKSRTGLELRLSRPGKAATNGIHLELTGPGVYPAEGYSLEMSPNAAWIRASSAAGLFYGVQTLLQAADARSAAPGKPVLLPSLSVRDEPRFGWRGLMLDESRHFFGKQTVKELLDVMAWLKLNRFHWHLTDEPGWRIEITKYPRLTSVGGRGSWSDSKAPVAFYTQADIREIVEYAARRHIMIVPEIDMPGHATAACRAYPEYSGGGTGQWAGFTFNPAKEETYRFLEDVLREVARLFPGNYIHLGGDEVHFGNQSWSTDPEIVEFTRKQGLKNAAELEQYFVRRMASAIQRLGKTTMGWDEIAGAGVPASDSAVMWWRHDKPQLLKQLLEKDYRVVLCPRLPCYFDFVQDKSHQHGRRWNGRFNTLSNVYQFPEPVTDGLVPAGKENNVLGVQACVWTERISNRERLGFMTFPRLAALAEAGWTPAAAKDEKGFERRLRVFLRELDRRGIPYFNPFDPARTPEPPAPEKKPTGTANG